MIPAERLDGREFAAKMASSLKVRAELVAKLKATMTHKVVRCEDGCWREDMFSGSREGCLTYLRKHWYDGCNKGGSELHLMHAASGRFESFVL